MMHIVLGDIMRCTIVALAAVAVAASATAQEPPASQHATLSQTINTTVVSITYDRPAARGRVLFGDSAVVMFDALWTPGANRATTLESSRDVRIIGVRVPAGRYSVWTMPGREEWILILNRTWDTQHAIYPGESDDVLRVALRPQSGTHMETLVFYFPVVGPYSAVLHLHWCIGYGKGRPRDRSRARVRTHWAINGPG